MNSDLTEEEMRRALFGASESPTPAITQTPVEETVPEVVFVPPVKPSKPRASAKAFTPRLRVTLRVGNEFEGEMQEITHEADTLSSLLAEQEAVKAARKKFRYVDVVSVKSM